MRIRGFEAVSDYANQNLSLPERKTRGSAGYDLACAKDFVIKAKTHGFVPTGLKAYMPENEVLQIYPRSSLGFKKSLVLLNSVGVIDSDYYNNEDNEGEILIILYNFGDEDVLLKKGERIAQGIFMNYLVIDSDENDNLRVGGLGSTGN